MDLLQNNKFKKKITNFKNEVFLMFNFTDLKFNSIYDKQQDSLMVQSLTLGECISKFVSFRDIIKKKFSSGDQVTTNSIRAEDYEQVKNAKAMSLMTHLPLIQAKLNMLQLYVNSHDNLIIKIYRRELIQMPIRFDTLDFHLMTQKPKGYNMPGVQVK